MGTPFPTDMSLLWSCFWQTTLCLSLGLGIGLLWTRQPARAHYLLVIALIASFAAPIGSLVVDHMGWGVFVEKAPFVEPSSYRPPPSSTPKPRIVEPEQDAVPSSPASEPLIAKSKPKKQRNEKIAYSIQWNSILIGAWVFLSVLACVRLMRSFINGIRIVNRARPVTDPQIENTVNAVTQDLGLKRIPEVFVSDHVAGPLIWCWRRRPALLLPGTIARPIGGVDLRSVFHHELAHYRRGDYLAALLGELLACAIPWQPLAWWAKGRLGDLSEEACDRYALAAGAPPKTYANLLVDLLPQPKSAFALATVTNRKNLRRRIRQIMANSQNAPNLGRWWSYGATISAICVVAAIAVAQAMPTDSVFPLYGPSGEIVLGTGGLRHAAFSPDGRHVLTAGGSGMYLWDYATGDFIRSFMFHGQEEPGTLVFSPDGAKILAIKDVWNSGPATVWDTESGRRVLTTSAWFVSGAFSPEGAELVLVGAKGNVLLLNADTGEEIWSFRLQKGIYQQGCVAFSPYGDWLLITGDAGTIVCDPLSGGILFTYPHAIGSRVTVSHDGTQFVTGGTHETEWTAALWDIETGQRVDVLEPDQPAEPPKGLSFSPDDMAILVLASPFRLDVWDTETWQVRHIETGIYDEQQRAISRFYSAEFSPDGKVILVAQPRSDGSSNAAILLDAETGEKQQTLVDHLQVTTPAFSHKNNELMTVGNAPSVNIWNSQTGELLHTHEDFDVSRFRSVVFSPDNTRMLASGTPVTLFDLETGATLQTFGDGDLIGFSPDGKKVFTGRTQGEFGRLWDAETGTMLHEFTTGPVESIEFSSNGEKLLTIGSGIAKLWDTATGEELRTFGGVRLQIDGAAMSPDGMKIATTRDKTARLWDIATAEELHSLEHRGIFPNTSIRFIAFSPDGMSIVTTCEDTAKLWDTATGQELGTFQHSDADIGHPIQSAAFSPDGMKLVTAGDGIISRLWDKATGTELLRFSPSESAVVFSPDGTRVATIGRDKTARIWDISDLVDGTAINTFAMY